MKKDILVGVDVGSSLIKTVVAQLTDNENYPYQVIGVGKAPAKGIRQGAVVDMKDAEESLHQSLPYSIIQKTQRDLHHPSIHL